MKIIIKNGQNIKKLKSINYKDESAIQKLIYENPDIIPVEEIEDGIKTIKVAREFGIPNSGSSDLIGIDNNANLYIIECKLAYNPQIKREVIGQILEYASFLWQMNYTDFQARFKDKKGLLIEELFKDSFDENTDIEDFLSKLEENLSAGNFKLIIVVDKINDLLKRTLEFINYSTGTNIHLMGLEISYFKKDKLEIFAPNIFGVNVKTSTARSAWDEKRFLVEISGLDENKRNILIDLINFIKENSPLFSWGTGKVEGSLAFKMDYKGKVVSLFSIYTSYKISFNFGDIERKMGVDNLKQYAKSLNALKHFNLKEKDYMGIKYPSFELADIIKTSENLSQFEDIILNFSRSRSNN